MGAMAYGGHRKVAVGWTEGRASAASGLTRARVTVPEKVNGLSRLGGFRPRNTLVWADFEKFGGPDAPRTCHQLFQKTKSRFLWCFYFFLK